MKLVFNILLGILFIVILGANIEGWLEKENEKKHKNFTINKEMCTYAEYYKRRPDVKMAGLDAFEHYAMHGQSEGMCQPIDGSE